MTSHNVTAETLAPHLYKQRLANGASLLVKEIPGSTAATVQIWVKTGSVYEEPREAGITHLIEHMIFKGTPSRGPGAIAGAIEEVGGRINAYTSYEYTVYHATLASRHWQLAFDVLTDAVFHSLFDPQELEREKPVVLEEIGMRNDRPNIVLFQQLMRTAYSQHPYRRPVIGTEQSVSSFTREDILAYMKRHYRPENITVVIVGDVNGAEVQQRFQEVLGPLTGSGYQEPPLPAEPPQQHARIFQVQEDINQSHLALALPTCNFANPDAAVLDVIAAILGSGESSRLYHRLRDQLGLVYRIDAASFTPRDPGLLEITATLEPTRVAEAARAILVELFKLKYLPVSDDELNRIKRNLESDFIFNLERVEGQARVMGSFDFLTGDPREDAYLDRIRAVSRQDIIHVARKYFSGQRLTLGMLLPTTAADQVDDQALRELIAAAEEEAQNSPPPSLLAESYLTNVHSFRLENGIRLLVREDNTVPTVAIRAVFPGGLRGETEATNGAFAFISDLLPKGTEQLSGRELAVTIADMAGEINGFNGKNTFGLKADFLARFFVPGLKLVADILRTPAFNPEEAEKIRQELLDQLNYQEDSLPSVAFREFNRLLFPGHPYGLNTAGSRQALQSLTVEELRRIYHRHATPDQLVLAVAGDVKAAEVEKEVRRLLADWSPPPPTAGAIAEEFVAPEAPLAPKKLRLERDKAQVHIIIGFMGASLNSPDRFGIEVLETILNGQSGRLFTELRDRQSLAYSLSAFSMLGLDTGALGVYIGTSPDKEQQAIAALQEQLALLRSQPVDPDELARAKNILIGNYELGLETHGSQALEMALNETYGLGQNFGNDYIAAINAVTAEKIKQLAARYLLPQRYVLVSVGAVAPPEPATTAAEPQAATPVTNNHIQSEAQ